MRWVRRGRTGAAINHRFFPSFKRAAKETGMAAALSLRARCSKSTGTALQGAGVHVPRTCPRSVTWSGRVLTVRNSLVNRLVLIWAVVMSDKQCQTIQRTSSWTGLCLLLQTPEPNLVEGMKWLQGAYTQRFNNPHKLRDPHHDPFFSLAPLPTGIAPLLFRPD